MDLLIGLLLPLLMGFLKTMQSCHLIGTLNHGEQGVEFGFDLFVCLMQRLKEDRVARQQETAQTGLFVDHQFDQAVGVEDDDVGTIHGACTVLNALQTVAEDESQDSECCNRQCKKTEQKPAIEPRFQSIFLALCGADDGVVSGLEMAGADDFTQVKTIRRQN